MRTAGNGPILFERFSRSLRGQLGNQSCSCSSSYKGSQYRRNPELHAGVLTSTNPGAPRSYFDDMFCTVIRCHRGVDIAYEWKRT